MSTRLHSLSPSLHMKSSRSLNTRLTNPWNVDWNWWFEQEFSHQSFAGLLCGVKESWQENWQGKSSWELRFKLLPIKLELLFESAQSFSLRGRQKGVKPILFWSEKKYCSWEANWRARNARRKIWASLWGLLSSPYIFIIHPFLPGLHWNREILLAPWRLRQT